MRVGIATDHGGFSLKEELLARLRAAGHEIVDFGAYALDADDDYPDFVVPLAKAVVAGRWNAAWRSAAAASARRSAPTRSQASARRSSTTTFPRSRASRTITSTSCAWADGRSGRPSPGISSRRSSAPSSVGPNGICAASGKWRAWRRRGATAREGCKQMPRRDLEARHRESIDDAPARHQLSARRHDLSGRRQLQRVLEARHRRAVALLRSGGCREARAGRRSRPADPALVPLLARIRARHHGRSDLRLPRRWAVRSGTRPSFRPRQGAARSLRKMRGAARGLESRGGARAGRQLRLGLEERRRRPGCLRLGGRPPSAHALCQDGRLRDARRRLHTPPQLRRRGAEARHVCQA